MGESMNDQNDPLACPGNGVGAMFSMLLMPEMPESTDMEMGARARPAAAGAELTELLNTSRMLL